MFDKLKLRIAASSFINKSVAEVIRLMERKTGKVFEEKIQYLPYRLASLKEPGQVAGILQKAAVISSFYVASNLFHDEPRLYRWMARTLSNMISGGGSISSSSAAMYKALAEGLERHLWIIADDYFKNPKKASLKDMGSEVIRPEYFVGFSDDVRNRQECKFSDESVFLWIESESLTDRKKKFVPAQIVSAKYANEVKLKHTEPIIRIAITTGLATAPTRERAILRGALEVIERDAFMVTWLNKLSMPRVVLKELAERNESIRNLVEQCKRYNLTPHAILLCTDAPVYVVCGVIEDKSGGLAFTLGARASFSIEEAVEDSLSEALVTRTDFRNLRDNIGEEIPNDIKDFKRDDRVFYWARPENQEGVKFFISGEEKSLVFDDSFIDDKKQLERIVSWCKSKSYELFTVDIGRSSKNPTDWHVYFTSIPEMQPVHLDERYPYFSGPRLKSVPKALGYEPAKELNMEPPHPFP